MTTAPFELRMPVTWRTPVVFASPHSGRDYGAAFLARSVLDARQIRSSEDAFVDQLFDCAPACGAPLLLANAPRAFVDLNRASDELDPALIEGVRRVVSNPRIASGLGVVPRVVANARAIYRGKLSLEEATTRLDAVWHPWHDRLQGLLDEARGRFGRAVLIDCHSMPHEAIDPRGRAARPDVVLGDRFGASASPAIIAFVEAAFRAEGLQVQRNAPFAGAYTAQHYGRPARGQHVIQVEIDRALYMDEARIAPRPDFEEFRAVIGRITARLASLPGDESGEDSDISLAAE